MGNVMPPGGQITTEDFRLLDDWLAEGAPGATIGDAECEAAAAGSPTPPTGSPHGEAPGDPATDPSATHPDETCYDFPVHGQPIAGDTSTYSISSGEHYQVFYFKAPWAAGSLATYYGSVFDNVAVLHHWLMYGTSLDRAEGAIEPGSGSHIGQGATLLAGWAVGGREVRLPEGVGLRLLAPETTLLIE